MGDPFDPYREALVVETATVWPESLAHVGPADRQRLETHSTPSRPAAEIDGDAFAFRGGFCRRDHRDPGRPGAAEELRVDS